MNAFFMESAIDPRGDTDVMLYVMLFLVGLCLELGAYGKAYNETLNWLRKRSGGKIDSITDLPDRMQNAVAILWDVIFMGIGLLLAILLSVPFGVVWTLIIALFTWVHVRQFFAKQYKNPRKQRSAGVPESCNRNAAPGVQRRLEQLESLRSAGLLTDQEYQQKRQEILNGQ